MFFWQKNPEKWLTAVILTALCASCFSAIPLCIKAIRMDLTLASLMIIVGVKSLTAALLQYSLIGPKNFKFKPETKTEVWVIVFRSLFNLGWVGALATKMPSATTVLIFFSYPFYIIIISWMLGKELKRKDFFSLTLGAVGLCICIANDLKQGSIYGSLMVLGAAIATSLLLICSDSVKTERKSNVFALAEISCALLLVFIFFTDKIPDITSLNAMILSGVFAGLGMYALSKAMQILQSHQAAQIMLLQPILTIIVGILVLGEKSTLALLIGSPLILFACYIKFKK